MLTDSRLGAAWGGRAVAEPVIQHSGRSRAAGCDPRHPALHGIH
ncbi:MULTISPECIES: hypothetical protein [Actinomyces]|nr:MULTISPECIES: hypothetical protein [Actinomyces]